MRRRSAAPGCPSGPLAARDLGKFPGRLIGAVLNQVPFTDPDGTTGTDPYPRPDTVGEAFAGDLPKQEPGRRRALTATAVCPMPTAAVADMARRQPGRSSGRFSASCPVSSPVDCPTSMR